MMSKPPIHSPTATPSTQAGPEPSKVPVMAIQAPTGATACASAST